MVCHLPMITIYYIEHKPKATHSQITTEGLEMELSELLMRDQW